MDLECPEIKSGSQAYKVVILKAGLETGKVESNLLYDLLLSGT